MARLRIYSRPAALSKLDGRTKAGRLARETRADLIAHLGGKPSATQRAMVERAVQLTLRVQAMDRKFAETGEQTEHDSRTYLAWSAALSRLMRQIGIDPVTPAAPVLSDHLAGIAARRGQQAAAA